MATLWASPNGSNTSPYDTKAKAATNLRTAVSAASDGDTIIVEAGTTVMFSGGSLYVDTKSLTIRSEGNIAKSTGAAISFALDSGISFNPVGKTITFQGLTLRDGIYTSAYTTKAAIRQETTASGAKYVFSGVRFTNFDCSALPDDTDGGAFLLNALAGADGNSLYMSDVEVDHCYGNSMAAEDGDTNHPWTIRNIRTVEFRRVNFHHNGVELGKVGNGWIVNTSTTLPMRMYIYDSTFTFNSGLNGYVDGSGKRTVGDGGSFYLYADPTMAQGIKCYIYNSVFSDNVAQKGGAFWVGGNASAYVYRSVFARNRASDSNDFGGGAFGRGGNIDSANIGTTVVRGCLFLENSTPNKGGALRGTQNSGRMYIYNNTFVNNTAETGGNSIYITQHTGSLAPELPIIENNIFVGRDEQIGSYTSQVCTASIANNWSANGTAAFSVHASTPMSGNRSDVVTLTDKGFPVFGSALIGAGKRSTIHPSEGLPVAYDLFGQQFLVNAPTIGCCEVAIARISDTSVVVA